MEQYEIIIMVLGCESEPFISIENDGIRKTWVNNCPPNVKIIYYYGHNDETILKNDKLYVKSPEGLYNIGYKTIESFKYIKENYKYQYIFRTNISSYIDIKLLLKYIEDKPKENFYNGIVGNHAGIIFSSGAGYFLTPDLIELVLKNQNEWNHSFIDDVSLALLLGNHGIYPIGGMDRFDIINNNMFIPNNYYHYRLKDNYGNRNNDIIRFHMVHNIKNENKNSN